MPTTPGHWLPPSAVIRSSLITAIRYHRDSFHRRVPRLPVVLFVGSSRSLRSCRFASSSSMVGAWLSVVVFMWFLIVSLYSAMNIHASKRFCWLLPATAVFAVAVTSTSTRGDDDGLLRWVAAIRNNACERGKGGPYSEGSTFALYARNREKRLFSSKNRRYTACPQLERKNKIKTFGQTRFLSIGLFNLIFHTTKYKISFRF